MQGNSGNISLDGPRVEIIGKVGFDLCPHVQEEWRVQAAAGFVLSELLCETWADQNRSGGHTANVNLLVTEYLTRIASKTARELACRYLMIANSFGLSDNLGIAPRCTW